MKKLPQVVMCKRNIDAPNKIYKAPHVLRKSDQRPDLRFKMSHMGPQDRLKHAQLA